LYTSNADAERTEKKEEKIESLDSDMPGDRRARHRRSRFSVVFVSMRPDSRARAICEVGARCDEELVHPAGYETAPLLAGPGLRRVPSRVDLPNRNA
jgi:hypothetical protein